MKIKHIFFDLDHTLWDFEKNSELTFHKIFSIHNIELKMEDFLAIYKSLNITFWKLYREEKVTKEELRYGRLKQTFDRLHYVISDDVIHKLSEDYITYLADFNHLFDGTFEILDYLSKKYQMHIITNGFHEIQYKKMVNSNIYHYFSQIITSESVGLKKPNPKVFLHALELADAKKEASIMIGDSLEADVEGALNIGMHAIHCCFEGQTETKKDIISVNSLLELRQYL